MKYIIPLIYIICLSACFVPKGTYTMGWGYGGEDYTFYKKRHFSRNNYTCTSSSHQKGTYTIKGNSIQFFYEPLLKNNTQYSINKTSDTSGIFINLHFIRQNYRNNIPKTTAKLYVGRRLIDSLTFDTKDTIRLSSTKQKPAKLKIISKNHYPLTIKIKEQGCYNIDAKLFSFWTIKALKDRNTYKIIKFDDKTMKLESSNNLFNPKKSQVTYVKYNLE